MKDKLDITIKVADLAPLGMSVTLKGEEDIRLAEYYVNLAWKKWMQSKRDDQESKDILGMVAIHFTKLYIQELRKKRTPPECWQILKKDSTKCLTASVERNRY